MHYVSMPTPDPKLAPLVGDTLEVVVGIADDKVLVAVGRDAAKTLKKAIDQSKTAAGKEVPPLQITLAVTPDRQVRRRSRRRRAGQRPRRRCWPGCLEKAGDKDHVTITAQPDPAGRPRAAGARRRAAEGARLDGPDAGRHAGGVRRTVCRSGDGRMRA